MKTAEQTLAEHKPKTVGWNAPKKGQCGFQPRQDFFDRTGVALPKHLRCEIEGCGDPAILEPHRGRPYRMVLCKYHSVLADRNGAPIKDDFPWAEYQRIRAAADSQLIRLTDTGIYKRAIAHINQVHREYFTIAKEREEKAQSVPNWMRYGISQALHANANTVLLNQVAFTCILERGLWSPMDGFPRHETITWRRCQDKAWPRGTTHERPLLGVRASLKYREKLEPGIRQCAGRTDYALREANDLGRDWLLKKDALPWFADTIKT